MTEWLSLWWRRLTHRIDPALVAEAHIQAAKARAMSKRIHSMPGATQAELLRDFGHVKPRTPDTGDGHE